jgi:hypothetical protein
LILYVLQARFRYPFLYFKNIGNAWPYFYYASISAETPRLLFPTRASHQAGGVLYGEDFVRFARHSIEETPAERARVELQQYFLLLAYQGYVNQFSLRLANWFLYGLVGVLLSTLVIVFCVLVF